MKLYRKHWVIILVAPLMVVADQFTKLVIHSYMKPYEVITIMQGYLNIYYAQNYGLAFGLFSDKLGASSTWIFLAITIVALAIIIHLFFRTEDKAVLLPMALSLVLAGALGNLIDRFHWGYVVDFIQMYFVSKSPPYNAHYWPTYNVADISISAGIVLLIIDSFRPQREAQPEQESGGPGSEGGAGA